jgi:hypothetical protein
MRLLPRDEKFYSLFLKQVEIISEAARLLLDGVCAGNARMATLATEIRVLESKGDEIIHEIFTRLNQTFITPIDPEDIHNLSSALDNVLDGIEDTAHRLVSYHIERIPASMVRLSELIAACAKTLKSSFTALAQMGYPGKKVEIAMPDYFVHKASDLADDERLVVERWLGRPLSDDETISINAYRPHAEPDVPKRQALRRSILEQAREIGSRAAEISNDEIEHLLGEALDDVRGHRR